MRHIEYAVKVSGDAEIIVRFDQVEKSEKYPDGCSYAIIGRRTYEKEAKEIIRIDNSPHEGKAGTHVHFIEEKRTVFASFRNEDEAFEFVKHYLTRGETHEN